MSRVATDTLPLHSDFMKRSRKADLTVEYVDGLLVNNDVLSTRFACDLCHCRGACCTMPGGTGAPLTDAEVPEVIAAVEAARPYLSTRKRALIARPSLVLPPGTRATLSRSRPGSNMRGPPAVERTARR